MSKTFVTCERMYISKEYAYSTTFFVVCHSREWRYYKRYVLYAMPYSIRQIAMCYCLVVPNLFDNHFLNSNGSTVRRCFAPMLSMPLELLLRSLSRDMQYLTIDVLQSLSAT